MLEANFDGDCFISPPDGTLRIGEVIISYPQAKKQAREHGHKVKKEVAILIIHGVLHLLGYDHDTTTHKRVMRKREKHILGGLFDSQIEKTKTAFKKAVREKSDKLFILIPSLKANENGI